jgi:hypothetical protein
MHLKKIYLMYIHSSRLKVRNQNNSTDSLLLIQLVMSYDLSSWSELPFNQSCDNNNHHSTGHTG